jgi:hypothetical protein
MPFAVLLTVYALWKIYNNRSFGWFIVLSVGFALVLNSHYLGLLLAPFIGIYLFITYISTSGKSRVSFIKHSLVGLLIGAFLMSPLLIFDMRHGWINTKAVTKFFSERQTTVSARPWNALPKMIPLGEKAITRLVAGRNILAGRWTFIAMLGSLIWIAGINRERLENKEKKVYLFLLSWLFIAFVGLGLYKQEIYDHYYGFFFPAPFLLLGGICEHLINKHKIRGSWIVLTGITLLAFYNFLESPLKYHPNMQLTRTRVVSQKILEESKGEPFNLGVIAERNYEDAYQYYLEKWNSKVVDIDPLRADETITDQLFVVCEMPPEKCDPTHNAKAEVANFGWSKIDNKWEVYGVQIFKLVHTQ